MKREQKIKIMHSVFKFSLHTGHVIWLANTNMTHMENIKGNAGVWTALFVL